MLDPRTASRMRLECHPTRTRDAGRAAACPAYSVVVPASPRPGQPREPGPRSGRGSSDTDPEGGPSTPTFLRRFGAVLVDWLLCQLITVGLLGVDTAAGGGAAFAPLAVFAVENILLVSLTGSTIGHRLFGMQVWQVRRGTFPLQVVVRTVLLCLFVPAVLTSRDGRGFHDAWAGTRIVRP